MGEQQPEGEQDEQLNQLSADSNNKRKLLDSLELAKQKAQQLASRLVNDAEPKRQRLEQNDSFSSHPNPFPTPSFPVASQHYGVAAATSKKISIPNGKVGVVIGKGGETIKYIQLQSGAKIQITKDHEVDPHSLTRDVELIGTSDQISRAEHLINDAISESDAGGSGSSVAQGLSTKQSSGGEQYAVTVPNDKVGLLIGKGGETIKYMQGKSGARMQIIPLHLPPGDTATERTVYINGTTEQIEAAKELVNEVISGKRLITPSVPNTYSQQAYTAPTNWAQQGQPQTQQQPQYGYMQPAPSYYGNYTSQQPAWDQSNASAISQTPSQVTAGYGYYGQQPQMGSASLNPSYGYSQTPVAGNNYDQAYGQQPTNISSQTPATEQQNSYATTCYGMDAAISSQPTSQVPAYPPYPYSQPVNTAQVYWAPSSYAGQPAYQTGYDQSGYPQSAYGATQPVYGQGGYPLQPTPPPANYAAHASQNLTYGHGQPPHVEAQPESQAPSNEPPPPQSSSTYGAETHDGANTANGSNPSAEEAVPPQS